MTRMGFTLALFIICLLRYMEGGSLCADEFTLMSDARRILDGQVPYRDFFEFLAPMSLYLLAGFMKVFGASLATTRLAVLSTIFLSGCLAARVGRRLGLSEAHCWLPALGLVALLFRRWPFYSHHWLVLPFELGALELALVGLQSQSRRAWVGAGCLVGLATLTLQTDGIGLGLALAGGLMLEGGTFGGVAWLGMSAASTLGLGVTGLWWSGALESAWHDVIRWPLTVYRVRGGINDVRLGSDFWLCLTPFEPLLTWPGRTYPVLFNYLLPLSTLTIAAALNPRPRGFNMLALWAIVSFMIAAQGRADFVHLSMYALPGLMVFAVFADQSERSAPRLSIRRAPSALLWLYVASGVLMLASSVRKEPNHWLHPQSHDKDVADAPIIRYLNTRAEPQDRMVAVPYGGYFYFYGPRPASPYSVMLPKGQGYGMPNEYQDFWADVARNRPRFIVIAPFPEPGYRDIMNQYLQELPSGYHLGATLPLPDYGPAWPAQIYERDDKHLTATTPTDPLKSNHDGPVRAR